MLEFLGCSAGFRGMPQPIVEPRTVLGDLESAITVETCDPVHSHCQDGRGFSAGAQWWCFC